MSKTILLRLDEIQKTLMASLLDVAREDQFNDCDTVSIVSEYIPDLFSSRKEVVSNTLHSLFKDGFTMSMVSPTEFNVIEACVNNDELFTVMVVAVTEDDNFEQIACFSEKVINY